MASKVFIDANVLIDLALHRSQYEAARELYHCIESGEIKGFISPSIVHLVAYWIKKYQDAEKAKGFLIRLCDNIEIVSVDHKITTFAVRSSMKDVEDALQYYAALEHHMQIFISNDRQLKRSAISSLPVLNPDEFIKILRLH